MFLMGVVRRQRHRVVEINVVIITKLAMRQARVVSVLMSRREKNIVETVVIANLTIFVVWGIVFLLLIIVVMTYYTQSTVFKLVLVPMDQVVIGNHIYPPLYF